MKFEKITVAHPRQQKKQKRLPERAQDFSSSRGSTGPTPADGWSKWECDPYLKKTKRRIWQRCTFTESVNFEKPFSIILQKYLLLIASSEKTKSAKPSKNTLDEFKFKNWFL